MGSRAFDSSAVSVIKAATRMLSSADVLPAGRAESDTCAVKENVPLRAGMPDSVPLRGSSFTPGGRAPEVIDQRRGGVPPEAVSVAE